MNSKIVLKSKPLPTSSSRYTHKNCINSTKREITRVTKNGPIKLLIIYQCSRFMQWVSETNAKLNLFRNLGYLIYEPIACFSFATCELQRFLVSSASSSSTLSVTTSATSLVSSSFTISNLNS